MRKSLLALCLVLTTSLSALCPIHEDKPKNIQQRAQKVAVALDRVMDIIYDMYLDGFVSEDELEVIQINYMIIQKNLGREVK